MFFDAARLEAPRPASCPRDLDLRLSDILMDAPETRFDIESSYVFILHCFKFAERMRHKIHA